MFGIGRGGAPSQLSESSGYPGSHGLTSEPHQGPGDHHHQGPGDHHTSETPPHTPPNSLKMTGSQGPGLHMGQSSEAGVSSYLGGHVQTQAHPRRRDTSRLERGQALDDLAHLDGLRRHLARAARDDRQGDGADGAQALPAHHAAGDARLRQAAARRGVATRRLSPVRPPAWAAPSTMRASTRGVRGARRRTRTARSAAGIAVAGSVRSAVRLTQARPPSALPSMCTSSPTSCRASSRMSLATRSA